MLAVLSEGRWCLSVCDAGNNDEDVSFIAGAKCINYAYTQTGI